MASTDARDCKICFCNFDLEHRRPRFLGVCGHSFCTACVNDMIKSNQGVIKCPICREEQKVTASSELNINYSIEDMLSADLTPPVPDPEPQVSTPVGPKLNAGICNDHGQHQLFRCNTCSMWICHVCTVIEHPRDQCSVVAIKQALDSIKNRARFELTGQISTCDEAIDKLNIYSTNLEKQIQAHQRHLVQQETMMGYYKEVMEALEGEKGRVEKVRCEGYSSQEDLKNLREHLNDTITVQDVNDCLRDSRYSQTAAQNWSQCVEGDFPDEVIVSKAKKMQVMTKFSLELMNWDIISHLKEEDLSEIIQATKGKVLHSLVKANEVFAVMDKGDHQCFAPLTWEDDCFTFGALQEEQPSASALKLPFNEFVNQTAPVYAVVCKGSHQLVARTTCVNGGFCLDSLREMSIPAYSCKIPLLDTLIKAGLVYAVDEDDPRGGVAQLSKLEDPSDTRLALHVLKAEPLPQNIFKMPYSYLRSLVGDSSVSVFLDLEWGDVTQGQVHIRLDATSGRGQQFLELCTGERGPSYIDTKFLSVGNRGNPGEFIIGGDYEHNDGTGGAAVLSGLDHSEGIPRNIVVGLVSGHNHGNKSSQFLIYTKDLPGSSDCMSFGKVKVGMDVLLAVVGLSNPQDVKVKDCGVFVSL